jgi:hypothetical protein
MVRYFYVWIPASSISGRSSSVTIPYLAVLVLVAVLLAVVAALSAFVWVAVSALYPVSRPALNHTTAGTSREVADTSPRVALHSGGLGGGETR